MGAGLAEGSTAKLAAGTEARQTPLTMINCPHTATAHPVCLVRAELVRFFAGQHEPAGQRSPAHGLCRLRRRLLYLAQLAESAAAPYSGPRDYSYVHGPNGHDAQIVATSTTPDSLGPPPALANGVCFALSMIRPKDVTDGLSNTYLLGENTSAPTTMRRVKVPATTNGH